VVWIAFDCTPAMDGDGLLGLGSREAQKRAQASAFERRRSVVECALDLRLDDGTKSVLSSGSIAS
jgi:hypothetical protein